MDVSFLRRFQTDGKRLILALGMTLLALQLGFRTFTPQRSLWVVQYLGYPLLFVSFALFLVLLVKSLRRPTLASRWRRGGWKILLLIVGLSGFLHLQERHGFKIINDELLLLSTSQRMHETRESTVIDRGYPLSTNFVLMQGHIDKRPLFYPFLLSLVHDLTGYRPENTFLLNGLLTPLLFGLLYLVVARVRGRAAGIVAMLLFATLPLLTQAATGGGFELLNLVMILATIYLGMQYAEKPAAGSLSLFCLSGVLLAQVRYESVLFVLPVGLVILWITWRQRRLLLPWPLLLSPLLLLAYPLQYNSFKLSPDLWQLGDRPSEHGVYSLAYFYDNVGHALRYFFEWDHSQPNSQLIALGGLIGLGFFWAWLYRHYRTLGKNPAHAVYVVFLLALCAQAVLMLCYFWGAYDDLLTVRLSLPTQLLMVLTFVFVYAELVKARTAWLGLGGLIVGYLFVWTVPTLARRAYAHNNLMAETTNWYRDYLRTAAIKPNFIIESGSPLLWRAYEIPGVPFSALAARAKEFLYHYQRHSFKECLVIQRMIITDFATAKLAPLPGHDLGKGVKLEQVAQFQFTPTYYIRISRITDIDPGAFLGWAKAYQAARKADSSSIPKKADTEDSRAQREAKYISEWLSKLP